MQENYPTKSKEKRQDGPRHILRTAAVGAALLVGIGALNPSYANFHELIPNTAMAPTAERVRKVNESIKISERLVEVSPYKTQESRKYMKPKFVFNILEGSSAASKQLNVPDKLVLAQWLMETGMLQPTGFSYVSKNNFAGIKERKRLGGFKAKEFGNVDDFEKYYARILRKDGLHDTQDFWGSVKTLHDSHYFTNESAMQYGNQLLAVLSILKDVGPEYNKYYGNAINQKKHFTPRQKTIYSGE